MRQATSDPAKVYAAVIGAAVLGVVLVGLVGVTDTVLMRNRGPAGESA